MFYRSPALQTLDLRASKVLGLLFALAFTSAGCKRSIDPSLSSELSGSSINLLQARVVDLWPVKPSDSLALHPKKPSKTPKDKPLPPRLLAPLSIAETTQILLRIPHPSGKTAFYEILRADARWWLLRRSKRGEIWLKPFPSRALSSMTFPISGFLEAEDDPKSPSTPSLEAAFFHDARFLLRALRTPRIPASSDSHPLALYTQGRLYRSAPDALPFARWLDRLASDLSSALQQNVWIPLPSEFRDLPFSLALQMGERIERQRRRLLACFKQHTFPSNLGPLPVVVSFLPNGSLRDIFYPTKTHKGKNPSWCIHAGIKTWKIQESPLPSVSFPIAIPPQGPPPPLPPTPLYKPTTPASPPNSKPSQPKSPSQSKAKGKVGRAPSLRSLPDPKPPQPKSRRRNPPPRKRPPLRPALFRGDVQHI